MRVEDLARTLDGDVIPPVHADYDTARATFNGTIDRRPVAIARPRTSEGVAAAVRWARDADLPIAIRGGGHSVAGHATADDALVIDLRSMRDIEVDPKRRRATVGGGALWVAVDLATTSHGLAMPGGTFGDTGVGGLTLGGGLGFLMGTGGLTCDSLIRAEVVTAVGEIVVAGEGGDPELLWALRGGGGNFGVVTQFEYALRPVGPIYAGRVGVPLGSAGDAMQAIAEIAHDMPDELVLFATGPAHPEEGTAAGSDLEAEFSVTVVYQGPADEAEAIIRPLRALRVVSDDLAMTTYLDVQGSSGQLPFGLRHYWKGQFLRELDRASIDALVAAMDDMPGPESFILLEALSGMARREPADGAAFGQRAARWNVSAIAIWEDAADDPGHIGWARDLADALRPASLTGAGYANYAPVDETPDRVRAAFGTDRFARLAAVKRRYDPDNVFRFNFNVPP